MATTSKDGSRRANYPLPIPGEVVTRHNDFFASNSGKVLPLKSSLEWWQCKYLPEYQLEDKSGASTRGNSSSNSVC